MNVPAFFRVTCCRRGAAQLLWKYSKGVDDRKFSAANVVCQVNVLKRYEAPRAVRATQDKGDFELARQLQISRSA
jgi:hypothetical protein